MDKITFRYFDKDKVEHFKTYGEMTCLEAVEKFSEEFPDQTIKSMFVVDRNCPRD